MKPLLAILCSAALVWAQGTLPVRAQVAAPAAGSSARSCWCRGKACCCLAKNASGSKRAPAAPAPGGATSGQLLLVAPGALAFTLPELPGSAFSPPPAPPPRAATPPLYQQNCALLI